MALSPSSRRSRASRRYTTYELASAPADLGEDKLRRHRSGPEAHRSAPGGYRSGNGRPVRGLRSGPGRRAREAFKQRSLKGPEPHTARP